MIDLKLRKYDIIMNSRECTSPFLIILVVIITLGHVSADGVINFVTPHEQVKEEEFKQATFHLQREGGSTSIVSFYCRIMNSTGVDDFVSLSVPGQFTSGMSSGTCTFTVQDDNTPEGNETFLVQIAIQSGSATIGANSTAYLTILSNDDPYGIVQFQNQSERISVEEPLQGNQTTATFNVIRRRGTIGTSIVYWQASNFMGTAIQDFSPTSGFLTFQNGESLQQLNISVFSDKVPENQEQFMIDLVNATGGAKISTSANRAILDIPANDPPIQFLSSSQTVSESNTLIVTVTRGRTAGVSIGNINMPSTVNYATMDGSARAGIDYQAANGMLNFASGESSKTISISILNDQSPEMAENFSIGLSNPSQGSVLGNPNVLTVLIQKNDDPHGVISFANQSQALILDEDSQGSGILEVNRLQGTFGTVAVSWSVVASSRFPGSTPDQVINATSGIITFGSGVSKRYVYIGTIQDTIPEEAVEFTIQLSSPSGGARLEPGQSHRAVIVQDSDNAYGAIFLGNASESRVDLLTTPRRVLVPVKRTGGALASVAVTYTVAYFLPGSSVPSNDVTLSYDGFVTIANASFNSTIEIRISETSFLRTDAAFLVVLNSTRLDVQTIVASNSPILGSPRRSFVNVTSIVANGEISFFGNPVSLRVNEPSDGQSSNVSLLVMRDGVSGPATVSWRVITTTTTTFTIADASPWNGSIYFQPGVDRVNITLSIHPDNIPELDETFIVELTNVSEQNERIREGASRATLTIVQNDNAKGIFEFDYNGSMILMEGDVSSVDVVRLGGALTTQRVYVTILGGQDDFITYRNILTFPQNQRRTTFLIFTNNDNIPEAKENFTMTLTSIAGSVLGQKTSILITIPQNDDANGVFSFTNSSGNLKKYADEIRGSSRTVSFEIQRQRGTFSSASVFWNVTSLVRANASLDLDTLNGIVHFSEGQITRQLNIRIKPDVIPEGEEVFQIHLTNITGGGRLVDPLVATLIINPNDAPIHFLYPLQVVVIEGQSANFTVSLNRTLSHNVTVTFSTMDVTAVASSGDYEAVRNGTVVFQIGERRKTISINTTDDNISEIAEKFIIHLQSSTGDTVLIPPIDATVIISANDDPFGIFQFSQQSLNKVASEGNTVFLEVLRSKGMFGNVTVNWEILSNRRTALQDNGEFVKARGGLVFREGSSSAVLSITVRPDGVPELNETFYVRLINATGDFVTPRGGYIGNLTEATILVLPSDDPYGLIRFAPSSLQVSVAEDYLPGLINATYANLTVERAKGTVGSIKVIWQLYKAANVPNDALDLVFFGQRGNDVTDIVGRSNSGTPSVYFNASNASYVFVSSANLLATNTLPFSLSLWMKPGRNIVGTLITKRDSSSNEVIYQLSLHGSASPPYLTFQVNTISNIIPVPSSVNLFDGSWHSVVLTIGETTLNAYVDGISSRRGSMNGSVSSRNGNIYLGCSLPTRDHYLGALQDVRLYSFSLIPALVSEVSSTIKAVTPVSGYLTYAPGASVQQIFLRTVDNSIPEAESIYTIKLIGLSGDGRLGTSISSRITILKSDNANGEFGFRESNCQTRANETNTSMTFFVTRTISTFGSVQVNWEIRQLTPNRILATNDFEAAKGGLLFGQGDAEKSIVIRPLDDSFPEFNEQFELRLVSAVSTDGTVSSTPTSGASIRSNSYTCNITLLSNDDPNGVLQVTGSTPNGTGIIPKMDRPDSLQITEESGRVNLYVVRAQGIQGAVTCEWKTNQVTARGNIDYREAVGTIELQDGKNVSMITVDVIDNNTPELEKLFNVQLYNPTGGAVLGIASYINITILPSDNAYGIFSFANESLNTTVTEIATAVLSVVRLVGNLGTVRVTWRLFNGSSDFSLHNGSVVFTNGQTTAPVSIPVLNDALPELTESFKVRLTSVTNGKLASQNTEATIRISSNDDPYGIFEIGPAQSRVQERNDSLQLTISRRGGSLGIVRVSYQTFVPAANMRYATPDVDFMSVSAGSVDFAIGQKQAHINITIIEDSTPENDEYFMVNLTAVRLIGASESVVNSPKLGASIVSEVIIEANDDANGILQLSSSAVVVNEGAVNFLNVTRTKGSFGEVSVRFTTASQNAVFGTDYQVPSYLIQFINGQTEANVPVQIINDDLPEFNESLVIRLEESSLTGGVKLGSPKECIVTILENDYPYGLIGFAGGSLNVTVTEPATGTSPVRLTVMRSGGTSGTAQIEWNATIDGQLASADVTPSSGSVRFISGQRSQDIEIFVKADNVPEDNKQITVVLGTVSTGKVTVDASTRSATLTIPANDDPYGVVQFNQSSIIVEERDVDYFINIPFTRTRGLFGTIRVFYSTKDPSPVSNKAESGGDYRAAVGQSTDLGPGATSGNVTIQILKDNAPELDEYFLVEITRAEVVGAPSGSNNVRIIEPKIVNVTIRANDQPYGLLGVYMKNTGGNGSNYAIIEPESGATSITFEIRRSQGSLGIVSVSWRVGSSSSVNISSDVSGVSGGTFNFLSGERTKEFIVHVHSDVIPEADERLIIELYDPRGGATIDLSSQRATLVIMANDGVGGKIGFRSGSRSQTVAEGQNASLIIYRTAPAAGDVSLNWTVEGVNASSDFAKTSGVLLILQGTTSTILSLQTLNDSTPENHETFTVKLSDPITTGISSTGAAVLVPGDSTAIIVIGASDEPHGIVEFAPRPQPIRVTENVGTVDLRIVRIMGSIGNIAVHYQLNGVRISRTTTEGKYGEDFNSTVNNTVIIPDGSDSATIKINVINDNIPEQDEAFFVNITGVTLIGANNLTKPPKMGSSTYMQIIIAANDGTQGELAFAPKFERITVSEDIGSFNITVIRYKGSFGDVYAFYFLNRLTASSTDFDIAGGVMAGGPVRLSFANGEKEKNITVTINNDNITETDEQFEIGLIIQNAVGNGGVEIGKPDKALVTIAANDDANGVIRFAAKSTTQYVTEAGNGPISNNTGEFFVERSVGLFGRVDIQWRILGLTNVSDVSPSSGLIVFEQNVREKNFQVTAVADNVPELQKEYNIQLTIVSGGARLGIPNTATLVIAANDDPHGSLSIRAFPSMARTLNIEESTRSVRTVVRRNGGTIGEISVQYHTKDISALSISGNAVKFGFDQVLSTISAEKFYAFRAYGNDYLLLASSYRKLGVKNSVVSGSVLNEPYESTLFRWQGTFVAIRNITTDGGVKWSSFEDQNVTYIFAINHGTIGRYETMSQLMRLHRNETIELVQNIATKGGTDVGFFKSDGFQHMFIVNMKDNAGNSVQRSQLLKWQGSQFMLESSTLETKGASAIAVCQINGVTYIAIANSYDSSTNSYSTASNVYAWSGANRRFALIQAIQTYAASDVDCVKSGNENYLLFTSSKGSSRLYRFRAATPVGFIEVQTLASGNSGKFFRWNYTDCLVIASNRTVLYQWDNATNSFRNMTEIPVSNALDIQPFSIRDPVAGELQYLAATATASSNSYILRLALLSENADFVPRSGLLKFLHGQTSLDLDLTILSDSLPEMDESFSFELASPTGGGILASNQNLVVTILSNNNAYGRIAFADSSVNVNVTELLLPSVLTLDVLREFGSFGQISLHWNISSLDGSAVNDLSPTQGQLNLNQGVSTASILITIKPDGIPELDEQFLVRLTSASIVGAVTSNQGPTINLLKSSSTVTILANNEPYGVVGWKNPIEITTKEKEINSSALLIIKRELGTLADIRIDYQTKQAVSVSQNERIALPGVDYFTKRSSVVMKKDQREVIVYIKVRHDNITNINEVFKAEITNVALISGTHVPNSPRIDQSRREVEVVITEVALNRGKIDFQPPLVQRVSESAGVLTVGLLRSNGSEGLVGVHFTIEPRNASSDDYSPHAGFVAFSSNMTRGNLNITIIDDSIAELDEMFVIRLTKPFGGVTIGPQNEVFITITQNDHPYGLLSFNSTSRVIENVIEGQSVHLTVNRNQGLYGSVRVDWSCGAAARDDMTPWSGTLIFAENVTQATIDIQTIDDSIPELAETFTCILSNPQNGVAVSSNNNNASITILPSDKPYGLISIDAVSKQLVVAEPNGGYDGSFSVSISRSVGLDGMVTVQWKINAFSGVDNSNTTFNATSGVLSFAAGVSRQILYLQVLGDATPEESRKYLIYLERTTGGAELDVLANTRSEVTVAASGNPYGIVQFALPVAFNVSESVGTVNLSVTRTGGSIGQLNVVFTTSSSISTPNVDFSPANAIVTFNPGEGAKVLEFTIIDDSIPELAESFVINITSVNVVTSKVLNFETVNGIQVDIPPRIGSLSVAEITINANDNPYGQIGFLESRRLVHESDGIVLIPVNRTGGTFGTSTVTYTYTDGTAQNPSDYIVNRTALTFVPGEEQKFIRVQLVDDRLSEFQETFRLDLTGISGPASLGSIARINITIETSDNPYGLFGIFNTSLSLSVVNPNISRVISFPVYRKDGALSSSEVSWRVVRNVASASLVTEDITPATGSLTFNGGERGPKFINITVLSAGGPQEPEEQFTLQLYRATGGAALDHAFTNVVITILKKGYPNGLFKFRGTVDPNAIITEPQTGVQQIRIPVERDFGSSGPVMVHWTIKSSSGSASGDFTAFNTSLFFANGEISKDVELSLVADNVPEVDEIFELTLVSASNGAEINAARSRINFTVSANDHPHGLFILDQSAKRFEFIPSTSVRLLHFAIDRTQGTIGSVLVTVRLQYSSDGSFESQTVNFTSGQNKVSSTFSIASTRFLEFGSNVSISLQSATMIGQGSSMAPSIASNSPLLIITFPEAAANSIIEFDASTRYPTASTAYVVSNVKISRRGLFGNVSVNWRSGYPPGSFTTGTINPLEGSVSFYQGERTKSISFQIQIPMSLQNTLIYAVYLRSSTPAQGRIGWPKIGASNIAIIDPHGVVEIVASSLNKTVFEGSRVAIEVRRLLSTFGTIRIAYTTQKYIGSNAATEGVDFRAVSSTFDMLNGQSSATIYVDTLEDNTGEAERDEYFYVVLTSVQVTSSQLSASSPRISTDNRATVKIRDNDNPFGIISFTSQSLTRATEESAGHVVLQLVRNGGVFSRSTVLVRSIGGGESWQDELIRGLPASSPVRKAITDRSQSASAIAPGQDYLPINQEIVFEELSSIPGGGQMKSVNISIIQDSLAEPAEQFVIVITNVTGGASLPSVSNPLKEFSIVTINGNGYWNGEIGFTQSVATVNEDASAQVVLPLERKHGSSQSIQIQWQVWSIFGNMANQLIAVSGTASFAAGNATSSLTISLRKDQLPEFSSWFYVNISTTAAGAFITNGASGLYSTCNVTVLESDYPAGRIGFSDSYRFPVVTVKDESTDIRVKRYGGTLKAVTVLYQTVALINTVTIGDIVMAPARENQDFTPSAGRLVFPLGSTDAIINIKLTPEKASSNTYPKVFNITLMSPTNGAILYGLHQSEQVIISKDSTSAKFLGLRSSALRIPLTDRDIENVFTEMLKLVKVPPINSMNQGLMMKTIRLVMSYKASLPTGQRGLSNSSKAILLDVYDSLLSSSRTDTRGKSQWAVLLNEIAYNFLNDMSCPYTYQGTKTNFALTARRDFGKNLNGVKFTSGSNADFFRYPVNMFSSTGITPCADIYFIDYGNNQLFSSTKAVLNNKVMSSKIKSGLLAGMKVVFRVYTLKERVTPVGRSCAIWRHPSAGVSGDWISSNCQIRGQSTNYVECECQHQSEFAVIALSDNRTGYEIYFLVSCYIVIGACFLALVAHHFCAFEPRFTVKLLMQFIFAIMMSNILFVVGAYISPKRTSKPDDCGILGIAIHYFFLTQFTTMFAQACNLWRIFIMNDERTESKYLQFTVIGWGSPVIIIGGYVLITYTAYRWPFTTMYGDVHANGDMCFISNTYAALGSAVFPAILFSLCIAVVLVQSYNVKPQWKCYDDIYQGRYNFKEMRHILIVFALLCLAWLFAGLHLAYGRLWLIIVFTVLNIILGLYILVIYAVLRNQRKSCCPFKCASAGAPSLASDHELIYAPNSLNHSSRKLVETQSNKLSDWDEVELPMGLNPMDFPDDVRIIDSPDFSRGRAMGKLNESYDVESDEFDDLIFALKTGGRLTPAEPVEQELEEKRPSPRAASADQPQIRRIKIADTHL